MYSQPGQFGGQQQPGYGNQHPQYGGQQQSFGGQPQQQGFGGQQGYNQASCGSLPMGQQQGYGGQQGYGNPQSGGYSGPGNFNNQPQYGQGAPGQYNQQPQGGQFGAPQGGMAGGAGVCGPTSVPGPQAGLPTLAGPEYCATSEQVFFLSEKMMSFSGDDFTIKDNNNSTIYTLNASALSMKGSRTLLTPAKHPVLTMSHKMLSSGTWEVFQGKDTHHKLATLKKPGNAASSNGAGHPGHQEPHMCLIFLGNNTSHNFSTPQPDMVVSGDVKGKGYYIYHGPRIIAEISRKLATESTSVRLTGKDSYAVKVPPGIDNAFIIAIVCIVDELFHDK